MSQLYATKFTEPQVRRMLLILLPCTLMLFPLDWLAKQCWTAAVAISTIPLIWYAVFTAKILIVEITASAKTDARAISFQEAIRANDGTRPYLRLEMALIFHFLVWGYLMLPDAPLPTLIAGFGIAGFYLTLFFMARIPIKKRTSGN